VTRAAHSSSTAGRPSGLWNNVLAGNRAGPVPCTQEHSAPGTWSAAAMHGRFSETDTAKARFCPQPILNALFSYLELEHIPPRG
jgi:hypothetical protein